MARAHGTAAAWRGRCGRSTAGSHAPVDRYLPLEAFLRFEERARALGVPAVYAGVFVRSSFSAEEVFRTGRTA
jgi:lipoate synthase